MAASNVVKQIDDLAERARFHKREIRLHRRALQACRSKIEQLKQDCAAYGIGYQNESVEERRTTHGSIGLEHQGKG